MTPELNKIYQGDCLEIMRGWPDKCVDLVVTSPPYNQLGSRIPVKPSGFRIGSNGWEAKVKQIGYWDDAPEDEYQGWQKLVLDECRRISKGLVWYNHKLRYRDGFAVSPWSWIGGDVFAEIIWDRCGSMVMNAKRYAPSDERIYGLGRPHFWDDAFNIFMTVWKIAPERGIADHPCPFPIELPKRLIAASCPPGGVVLDPFCVSGTTPTAAEALGRKWIGIEINPAYVKIAQSRIDAERAQGKLL